MEFTNNNLTFVIVTFKSRKVIFNCLNSLPKNFQKLIIDNSSDKELKKEIEQNYDKTKVILSSNIGMGAANNIGIRNSNTEFVYVLNPDVKFYPNTLKKINETITNLKDFAIMSPISDNPKYPNYKGIIVNEHINYHTLNVNEIDGYSMILNKKYFNVGGYFDENIFMYLENVDLCLKAKKNRGNLIIIKNSLISHLGAQAVDEKYSFEIELSRNWHWMWSKFYFNRKHKGIISTLFNAIVSLFLNFIKYLVFLFIFKNKKRKLYGQRLSGLLNSMSGKKSWYRPKID